MGVLYNCKPVPEGWAAPLEAERGAQRAQGQRTAMIDTKIRHLAYFARSNPGLAPWDVTVEYVLAWAATKDWVPETRHGYYGSFKSFLAWLKQTTGNNRPVELPRVRRPRTKARPVPEHILKTLLTSPDPRISLGSRLAASAGLRRSEIIVVHLDDFRDDLLGRSLLVTGRAAPTGWCRWPKASMSRSGTTSQPTTPPATCSQATMTDTSARPGSASSSTNNCPGRGTCTRCATDSPSLSTSRPRT